MANAAGGEGSRGKIKESEQGVSVLRLQNMLPRARVLLPDGKVQQIDTYGKWDSAMLRFSNPRVDGWFTGLEADPTGLNSVLYLAFKDGSGLTVSEIITLSPDGKRRMRIAQYVVAGKIARRTLIDEAREAR